MTFLKESEAAKRVYTETMFCITYQKTLKPMSFIVRVTV